MKRSWLYRVTVFLVACNLNVCAGEEGLARQDTLQKQVKSGVVGSNFIGELLAALELPQTNIPLFKGFEIKSPTFVQPPAQLKSGVAVLGSALIKGTEVPVKLIVGTKAEGGSAISIEIYFPDFTLAEISPVFKPLDWMKISGAEVTASNFAYREPGERFGTFAGLTVSGAVAIGGPAKIINEISALRKGIKKVKGLVLEEGEMFLRAVIAKELKSSSIMVTLPLGFGLDFEELPPFPGKPGEVVKEAITKVFKKVSMREVFMSVSLGYIRFGGTVSVDLATQKEPIALTLYGEVIPDEKEVGITGQLEGNLNLHWFQLQDVGLNLNWNLPIMKAALAAGIPFTGIGFSGWLYLDKEGDKQTGLHFTGGVRAGQDVEFGLAAQAQNMKFSTWINFLSKKIAKKDIKTKLPQMTLNNLRVSANPSLFVSWYGGQPLDPGFSVIADVELLGVQGKTYFRLDPRPQSFLLEGNGFLSDINIKIKGEEIIKISGRGDPETGKPGPSFNFYFTPLNVARTTFDLDGTLEIPPLNIAQAVQDLHVGLDGITGSFQSTVGNLFDAIFVIDVRTAIKSLPDSYIGFSFQQNFVDALAKEIDKVGKKISIPGLGSLASLTLGAIQLKKAEGEFTFKTLTPFLSELTIEINLKGLGKKRFTLRNVEFNFKNYAKSVKDIAEKIVDQIQKEFTKIGKVIAEKAKQVAREIKKVSVQATRAVKQPAAKAVRALKKPATQVIKGVKKGAGAVKKTAKKTGKKIKKFFT